MKTLMIIEAGQKGVRKSTVMAQGAGDLNRVAVCHNGVQGYINRSGAVICREREAELVISKKDEVEPLLRTHFGADFTGLHLASTENTYNPAKQEQRDAYFKH